MGTFKIQDQKRDIKISETHYFKWLKETNQTNIHKTITKVTYLRAQGFEVGVDFITDTEIETLNYIENNYFRTEIIPTLKSLSN